MAEKAKKEKKESGIKKFFGEFKTFITRGNILDMAVGVIVGGAFTGIVNGLSNYILKPLINWLLAVLLAGDGLAGAVTFLKTGYTTDASGAQVIDLANSIYIDWGAFISSIINFLLIAFTLFVIVRTINKITEMNEKMREGLELDEKKAIRKIAKEEKVSKKEAKRIYEERTAKAKAEKEEAERIAKEEAEAEAARVAAEEEAKATANTRLLEEIRDLLKANK